MLQKNIKHLYFRTPEWVGEKFVQLKSVKQLRTIKKQIHEKLPGWMKRSGEKK